MNHHAPPWSFPRAARRCAVIAGLGAAVVAACTLAPCAVARAHAAAALPEPVAANAAPDSADASPADTGWVEIGGKSPFGADDPFADLPSAEEERAATPHGGQLLPYLSFERVDQFVIGLEQRYEPKTG